MIGTVGGYIGLCLGYSILQIPEYILKIVQKLKTRYSRKILQGDKITPLPIKITVGNRMLNVNPNIVKMDQHHQLINDVSLNTTQIEFIKLSERVNELEEWKNNLKNKEKIFI